MPDVRALAAAYGLRVELADLGDWGRVRLIAEYDPGERAIRVNRREVSDTAADAIDRAIAHELYHHREAIGEIPRLTSRTAREAAADAFAETLTAADLHADAAADGDDRADAPAWGNDRADAPAGAR